MTTITLPPLGPFPMTVDGSRRIECTADQLRTRDLEVARLVLEAAANWYAAKFGDIDFDQVSSTIRNLEIRHE